MQILFHFEEVSEPDIDFDHVASWIESVIESFDRVPGEINYIFCSRSYIRKMNNKHLGHDYETDTLTFNISDNQRQIDADIYISVENVLENATKIGVEFQNELKRVLVHGILHIVGFNDDMDEAKAQMRTKENEFMKLFPE